MGRGSSGKSIKKKNAIITATKPREFETDVYLQGSATAYGRSIAFKKELLEASVEGNELSFDYAQWKVAPPSAKTNKRTTATAEVAAGAIEGEIFGVDLSKASIIKGQTYNLRKKIKEAGFRWNSTNKYWEKT